MTKPSVELTVEVRDADGVPTRWSGDHPDAGTRPQGLVFRTQRMEGFADASVTLARRADRDYPDLNLADDIRFVGEDGTIAYEGRIGALPRSVDTSHSVTVQAAGWMTHATDRKFREIYVDRDLSRWGQPPDQRRIALFDGSPVRYLSGSVDVLTGGEASLTLSLNRLQTTTGVNTGRVEAWYDGAGIPLAAVYYDYVHRNIGATDWLARMHLAADAAGASTAAGTNHGNTPTATTLTSTSLDWRFAFWAMEHSGTTSSDGQWDQYLRNVAVYGTHGLKLRGGAPSGVSGADVIRDVFDRYAPLLDTSGVQDSTFGIEHLVFRDPTTPYDALLYVNAYHLWNAAVWENRTLHWGPIDRTDYDWEIRLSDGATWSLQGDNLAELANGITVQFTNVATGRPEYLTPDDHPELRDPNPNNPISRHGIDRWTDYTLSFPTTQASALQIGRAALAEHNQPKAPGTITCRFHVRDRQGNRQPAWRPRAGDTLILSDHPNDSVRVIHETSYDGDSHTLTIAVDSTRHALEAVIDRMETALTARNIQ